MSHEDTPDQHLQERIAVGGNGHLDLARLRLTQDFETEVGVKKILRVVPVGRPHRQAWVRVHPDPGWHLLTLTLPLRDESETYLIDPDLRGELAGEVVPTALFTAITRSNIVFIWPVRVPGEDGRVDSWSRSALDAAQMAKTNWIRLAANRALGAYEIFTPTGNFPDPEWPDISFQEVLDRAFRDHLYIRDVDHPVIRKLRGES
jgi:hypothetical protein